VIEGAINVSGARVSGGITIARTTFSFPGELDPPVACIRAVGTIVSGSVMLGSETTTRGDVDFAYAQISGAFRWVELTMLPTGGRGAAFSLNNATVGRGLEARSLTSSAENVVSLRGLNISSLDDVLDGGWGEARLS
jgi:hypothetical protein